MPCAVRDPWQPAVMIDKCSTALAAIRRRGLRPLLCRFHGVRAFAEHLRHQPHLSHFFSVLMHPFKKVLVATSPVSSPCCRTSRVSYL